MNNNLKYALVENQYVLPNKLNYLARYYSIDWENAQRLYSLCVEEILLSYNAKNILDGDLAFGRGYHYSAELFKEKLEKYFPKKER